MFGFGKTIKAALGAASKEVQADYSENKDYLEAVCAGSALVANADGELEDAERQKVIKICTGHPVLSKFYQRDAIEKCVETMFKRSLDASGRQSLARELDDIKSRPNGAQMAEDVYLVCVDVANADGQVEPEEEVVLKKIAARLGVDPSKFDF